VLCLIVVVVVVVGQVSFPVCYEPLGQPVLFEVEAFKPHICPDDDLWPCSPPEGMHIPTIDWGKMFVDNGEKTTQA